MANKRMTKQGTGRVAKAASPEYKPVSPLNKMKVKAFGHEWRPDWYRK